MTRRLLCPKGFTLIELLIVVAILTLIGVVAIPNFVDFEPDAQTSNAIGVVGGVRSGVVTYFVDPTKGNRTGYPANLDSAAAAACSATNVCFDTVLAQGGIMRDWEKLSTSTYRSPTSATNVWEYDSTDGSFVQTTA